MLATDPHYYKEPTVYEDTGYRLNIGGDRYSNVEPQLKDIYVALSRAVEEGDQLKIGIVLGQTLTKLESIINGN